MSARVMMMNHRLMAPEIGKLEREVSILYIIIYLDIIFRFKS